MTKSLYKDIISGKERNALLSLLGNADAFNEVYDILYKNDIDVVRVDKKEVFASILSIKDVDLIDMALMMLSYDKKYADQAINYLKEENDVKLTYEFIYRVGIRWDDYFDFLTSLDFELDNRVLWNTIVRKNRLGVKNMVKLLEGRPALEIMYLANTNSRSKKKHAALINRFFGYNDAEDEIKKIDDDFYEKNIKPIRYDDCVSMINEALKQEAYEDDENLQLSFFKKN